MTVVKRVGVVSAAKISGIITAIFGLIVGVILAFTGVLGGTVLGGHWSVDVIGFTVLYAIAGFFGGLIYAALYNLVAGWVGGIKIELGDA